MNRTTKHGLRHTSEYRIWIAMKLRCHNPRHTRYAYYGGRGIAVCERWQADFAAFFEDMGPRPTPGHSIDRVNNDKGYEPGNCRWATRVEQMSHTSRTVSGVIDGELMTMAQACRKYGLDDRLLSKRIKRRRSTLAEEVNRLRDIPPATESEAGRG